MIFSFPYKDLILGRVKKFSIFSLSIPGKRKKHESMAKADFLIRLSKFISKDNLAEFNLAFAIT